MPIRFLLIALSVIAVRLVSAQVVHEYMDLQIHPTMHMAHPIIKPGLQYFEEGEEPNLTYKHQLTNVNYANYLEDNPGLRIIVHGAIVHEVLSNPRDAKRLVLTELKYIDDFVAEHSDKFVVAKNPAEVRKYVHTTDKTVIIHSVEGAGFLIRSQEDANFWAKQGISFMTFIHLVDNQFGGAATLPGAATGVINFRGTIKSVFHPPGKTKGLTDKGKQAILWMANAGMMIDITHMSPQTRTDALQFMEEHGIPPLSTHDGFLPIQNTQRGIPKDEVVKIYKQGGLMALGIALEAYRPYPEYQAKLDSIAPWYCDGSIDSYQFTYQELKLFIEQNLAEIFNDASLTSYNDLSEEQLHDISIGFQTDFNGWLNHARPRVGEDGCWEKKDGVIYNAIDTLGLPHPGFMPQHWHHLEQKGVDLAPVKRASEKFLQMWEWFLVHRGTFGAN